jgi:hypothetical protein
MQKMIKKLSEDYFFIAFIFFALLFTFFHSYLIFISNVVGDDIYDSMFSGNMDTNQDIFEKTVSGIKNWWSINSRLNIFGSFMGNYFWWYIKKPIIIKFFHSLNFTLMILSFYYFSYLLVKNKYITGLIIFLTPLVIQFRNYHDAHLIWPLYSLTFFLFFLSLIFFIKFFKNQKKTYIIFSTLLFFAFNTTREEMLFLFPIYYIIERFFLKQKTKYYLIFVIPGIILFSFVAYYKLIHVGGVGSGAYDGTEIGFNVSQNFLTLFYQITAAIPLSHSIKNLSISLSIYDLIIYFFFLIFLLKYLKLYQEKIFDKIKPNLILIFLSLTLVALPIALSKKYINEINSLGFGYAHIPVMLQNLGFVFLLLLILKKIINQKNIKFVVITISLVSLLNFGSNKNIIENQLPTTKVFRNNLSNAFDMGILKKIPEYSNFIWGETYFDLWKRSEILSAFDRRIFFVMGAYCNDCSIYNLKVKNNFLGNTPGYGNFEIKKIPVIKNKNKYFFSKNPKRKDFNKIKYLTKSQKNNLYQRSSDYYVIFNLPNLRDNRVVIVKINYFEINKKSNLKNIFTNEMHYYSENSKSIEVIKLDEVVNFSKFASFYDLQNPKNSIKKNDLLSKLEEFKSSKNKILNDIEIKKISENYKEGNNFYTGKISCKLQSDKNYFVSKKNNFFLKNSALNYQKIKLEIFNNSNNIWYINDLKKEFPITIGILLKNSNINKKMLIYRKLDKSYEIAPGESLSIPVTFNDLIELNDKIQTIKYHSFFDQLIVSLVHEKKTHFFDKSSFDSCVIPLKTLSKTLKHQIKSLTTGFK